eukprot:7346898-Prymnesium_polylepis.1
MVGRTRARRRPPQGRDELDTMRARLLLQRGLFGVPHLPYTVQSSSSRGYRQLDGSPWRMGISVCVTLHVQPKRKPHRVVPRCAAPGARRWPEAGAPGRRTGATAAARRKPLTVGLDFTLYT